MNLLYEGKAKKIFGSPNDTELVMEFKDSLTAFNAQKKGSFKGKGEINHDIALLMFEYLKEKGVDSHFIKSESSTTMRVHRVKIIPFEVVVRNVMAGSLAKKLGRKEGERLPRALVEFYFKDDALGDPFMSEEQIMVLNMATNEELLELKRQALIVNGALIDLFKSVGINLVDFKLEFGRNLDGKIILADEISPDSCRLWDIKTNEKMDKDRFRQDLGEVDKFYAEILQRLREGLRA